MWSNHHIYPAIYKESMWRIFWVSWLFRMCVSSAVRQILSFPIALGTQHSTLRRNYGGLTLRAAYTTQHIHHWNVSLCLLHRVKPPSQVMRLLLEIWIMNRCYIWLDIQWKDNLQWMSLLFCIILVFCGPQVGNKS